MFAVFSFIMSLASFVFTGSGGADLLMQIGAEEIVGSAGLSMDDILAMFSVLSIAFAVAGLYQLLLGVLGIVFAKNPKRAPILIGLGVVALIFQALVVFLLLFGSPLYAMLFGIGLVVYALFLTGAVGNLRPRFSEPTILGPSSESLMSEVKMEDEE